MHATEALLAATLDYGVWWELERLAAKGGPSETDRAFLRTFGPDLAEHGDALLYRSAETARLVTDLCRAVAILAWQPGGVTIGDRTWTAPARPEPEP